MATRGTRGTRGTRTGPQCLGCQHFRRAQNYTEFETGREDAQGWPELSQVPTGECDAYPAGIPLVIWRNRVDHAGAYDGDRGVRYVAKDHDARQYHARLFAEARSH